MNTSDQSHQDTQSFLSFIAHKLKSLRTPHFIITFATIFLLTYVVLINFEANAGLMIGMFTFSQFMVIGIAYIVIRHGVYDGKSLGSDDEFGYEDYDHENKTYTRSLNKVMEQLKESKD
jgi:hypothetical protein